MGQLKKAHAAFIENRINVNESMYRKERGNRIEKRIATIKSALDEKRYNDAACYSDLLKEVLQPEELKCFAKWWDNRRTEAIENLLFLELVQDFVRHGSITAVPEHEIIQSLDTEGLYKRVFSGCASIARMLEEIKHQLDSRHGKQRQYESELCLTAIVEGDNVLSYRYSDSWDEATPDSTRSSRTLCDKTISKDQSGEAGVLEVPVLAEASTDIDMASASADNLPRFDRVRAKKGKREILQLVQKHGIEQLVHFTRRANLDSILRHGLLSRTELDLRRLPYVGNDSRRLDQAPDAVSLSIEFPNYRMFYALREEKSCPWAVIMLRPEILWEMECAFCITNAASTIVRSANQAGLKTAEALEALYAEAIRGRDRFNELPSSYPTDPQAEVLVYEPIVTDYILGVHLPLADDPGEVTHLENVHTHCSDEFFGPRVDYKLWQDKPDSSKDGTQEVPF
jgi:hypothetical protein